MFDVSWGKLVIIGVVALIVIGPKELPTVLRTIGQWMGKIRRMAGEFQGQFQDAMERLLKALKIYQELGDRHAIGSTLGAVALTYQLAGEIDAAAQTYRAALALFAATADYLGIAKQINRIDIYKQAAAMTKTPVPKDVMRSSKLIDGVVWDGKDPAKYADSFKVNLA